MHGVYLSALSISFIVILNPLTDRSNIYIIFLLVSVHFSIGKKIFLIL